MTKIEQIKEVLRKDLDVVTTWCFFEAGIVLICTGIYLYMVSL